MSDEKKDAVIQRGTPKKVKMEDRVKDRKWLKIRLDHLKAKKKALAERHANVKAEIDEVKAKLEETKAEGDE